MMMGRFVFLIFHSVVIKPAPNKAALAYCCVAADAVCRCFAKLHRLAEMLQTKLSDEKSAKEAITFISLMYIVIINHSYAPVNRIQRIAR